MSCTGLMRWRPEPTRRFRRDHGTWPVKPYFFNRGTRVGYSRPILPSYVIPVRVWVT